MDVLIIRHAIAEEREVFARTGKPDGLRPLTRKGVKRMRRAAQGLSTLVPQLETLATSPLVRAVQTADIVAEVYDDIEPLETDALKPAVTANDTLRFLQQLATDQTVALVGHEPSLSYLIGWLTAKADEPFLEFKKGGACLLSFHDQVYAGGATMRWLLTPAQLRRLGD
jgi:phosphohistidine phosphatase